MKNIIKKAVSLSLASVMGISAINAFSTNIYAEEQMNENENNLIVDIGSLSETDKEFLNNFSKTFEYFYFDEDNSLALTKSIDDIANEFGFDQQFKNKMEEILNLSNFYISNPGVSTRLHVSDWKIYFTLGDVETYLAAAASVGPAAITAALTALGTLYPGVGNIVGTIIGVVGGATICYVVLQAVANKQGVYIGIDWNGVFPNPVIGTW